MPRWISVLLLAGLVARGHPAQAQPGLRTLEALSYSKSALATSGAAWLATQVILITHEPGLEGERHYNLDHHLNFGFAMQLLGTYLRGSHRDFYEGLPAGLRALLTLGPLILWDDAWQHTWQLQDDYHGPGDPRSSIYRSPVHRLYWSLVRRDERGGPWKLSLNLLDLNSRWSLSTGMYQGMYLGVDFRLYGRGRWLAYLSLFTSFLNERKRWLHVRKVVMGPSVRMALFRDVQLEIGFGLRYGLSSDTNYHHHLGYVYWLGAHLFGRPPR